MPLVRVRNAKFVHRRDCAIHKPTAWLYEKDESGSFLVYDFIGGDCTCGDVTHCASRCRCHGVRSGSSLTMKPPFDAVNSSAAIAGPPANLSVLVLNRLPRLGDIQDQQADSVDNERFYVGGQINPLVNPMAEPLLVGGSAMLKLERPHDSSTLIRDDL